MTCTTHHGTIEEAAEVSVVMTCTTHHDSVEVAVEASLVMTCTTHHGTIEEAVVECSYDLYNTSWNY